MIELHSLTVHRDGGVGLLVGAQKALDGGGGVVDGLARLLADAVALLADVAVDAVAHAVDEDVGLAVEMDVGEIGDVGIEEEGLGVPRLVQIIEKVIARTGGEVVDIPRGILAAQLIDEKAEGSVPPP